MKSQSSTGRLRKQVCAEKNWQETFQKFLILHIKKYLTNYVRLKIPTLLNLWE